MLIIMPLQGRDMQKLFEEVSSLDKHCYDAFGLSEDILMEHAAEGMALYIRQHFDTTKRVVIVCGGGNNGADGIALARLLHGVYDVSLFFVKEAKSPMAKLQLQRANAIGVKRTIYFEECDIIVDTLFGTGFSGSLDAEQKSVMQTVNSLDAFKIACDIPSGIDSKGVCDANTFMADVSLTMGALKRSMYSDDAKEYVGKIEVIDLGVTRMMYERSSKWHLLDEDDMKLPNRKQKNTHKGSYGHLALAQGEKFGASVLSASAALKFGVGLVTLVGFKEINLPYSLMSASSIPHNATSLVLGMGLGEGFSEIEIDKFLDNTLPLVVDADLFSMSKICEILERENLVITPHPKEFVSLLNLTNLADVDVKELQENRFKYVELFCEEFPNVVLLLKGANVIIAKEKEFYINPHGTSILAKGGSGDVLSGLIGALLAQGYFSLEATLFASLAHTKLAKNYTGSDFSLTPEDLIAGIGKL